MLKSAKLMKIFANFAWIGLHLSSQDQAQTQLQHITPALEYQYLQQLLQEELKQILVWISLSEHVVINDLQDCETSVLTKHRMSEIMICL